MRRNWANLMHCFDSFFTLSPFTSFWRFFIPPQIVFSFRSLWFFFFLFKGNKMHNSSAMLFHLNLLSSQWYVFCKLLMHLFLNCYSEMDLLSMPSNTGSLRLVQWPLFLLSSKVKPIIQFDFYRYFYSLLRFSMLSELIFFLDPAGDWFGLGLQRYTGRSVDQDM